MKKNQNRTKRTEENMKLQQVFKPYPFHEEIVSLPGNIDTDTEQDHGCAYNTQTVPIGTAGLKPIMLRMIKSFLQRNCIIRISRDMPDMQ